MLVTVARCDGGFVRHLHTTLHYNHTTTTVRKQKDMKGANQFTFSFALFYPDSPELLAKSGVDHPSTAKSLWKCPNKDSYIHVSLATLNPFKLTMEINHQIMT
jgi:hypothetical protein